MRIVSFSDIHGSFSVFKRASKLLDSTDIVVLSGDITDFGDKKDAVKGIKELRKYFSGQIFAVTGNCDYPSIEDGLDALGINLNRNSYINNGFVFAGLSGSLITPFSTPNEYSENEYRIFLEEISKKIDNKYPLILVSHQPPFDSGCDKIRSGQSVGSKEVRTFIEKHSPVVCFTGHIHESYGKSLLGNTTIINPGQAKRGYAAVMDYNEGETDIYLDKFKK